MTTIIGILLVILVVYFIFRDKKSLEIDIVFLPERFVVFDLETTGLEADTHEILEIGAIRVNRDSNQHQTFQALIKPERKLPKKITQLTGITQDMVDRDGEPLAPAVCQFIDFIGDLPLVAYNAEFDMAFLSKAVSVALPNHSINNRVYCALKMARRAWPNRKSYRLASLAKDGKLSEDDTHRALGDCKRTLTVYTAAAHILKSAG